MEPRRCTIHILDIWWIISLLSVWNSAFNFLITFCLCSEFAFLSLWISYPFPLIICIFSILSYAWCHTHILLSRLNFLTNIGSWHLHPEISVVTIFSGPDRSGLSHDSSQLQSWLQKMHSTYIPENSNVQTKMQPCKSSSPLFIWVLISLQFKWKCTTVGVSLKIFLG